jgi:mono/diheme cytochrome c family protein
VIQPPRSRAAALTLLRRAILPILLLTALACNERPSDVREWRVSDHDHTANPGSDQVQVDPKDAGAPAVPGLEDVTIVAWQQNCTQCHGQLGRGDGPRGPMLKATNLSDPTWQSSVTDQQIAATIKLGKGAMPAFKLPDVTIANLTRLVRMMNVARLQAAAAAASASAAGAPSSGAPSAKPDTGKPTAKPSGAVTTPKPSPSGTVAPPTPSAQ